ncbi:hypothetical protein VB264_18635 [Arcicella aquatica]|uniref:Uncharacterized protein n=1 Tax=Arcicella aquatica TaxID=217141 RepID=A0ABU5QTZ6_9BACT|nr:hypothetical protein [Arcicella aquatica]MEA5259821.1 hypothetical protein [Arcicella aquatica]
MTTTLIENKISKDKNVLVVLTDSKDKSDEFDYLIANFCGIVVEKLSDIQHPLSNKQIYVCGDISKLTDEHDTLYIIRELSSNYENSNKKNIHVIALGQVPVIISNAGVYFRDLFNESDYFNKIKSEHTFQELTESNKEAKAFRKGIYLTEVLKEDTEDNNEILHYRLLRCSSNLTGPTDNFRDTDYHIINTLNNAVQYIFEQETRLNHVLAQIYENKKSDDSTKELKSRIKAHSDKTKDMPKEGIIAFCTFYDKANFDQLKPSETDKYDWCYKKTSALTKLHFKLKSTINDDTLEKEFSVTLYPNSAFLIPLSTNRLYTHEIRPSVLNIDRIPVRMGYVVRCSNLESLYMNNQTYIKENGTLVKLALMIPEDMENLRNSYYEENKTEKIVDYGKIHFSMNLGDYEKPIF